VIATLAMLAAISVSTKEQLTTAIAQARAGDVIQLAKANYGAVTISGRSFSSTVTIKSASASAPATLSGLQLKNVSNLTFQDIEFTRERGTDPYWTKMVTAESATNLSFIGGFVHGPANADWQDDMYGMYIHNSTGIRISGVTFHDLRVALMIEDSTTFRIEKSFFSYLSADAMDIPGTNGGIIANNSIFTFDLMPGAHPDGIQCWTAGKTTGCKNLQITSNTFTGTVGNEFQGIFFGDEAGVNGYDNIQIVGNVFKNLLWHAICIAGQDTGLTIKNNNVTAGPNYRSWIRTAGPATVLGNVAPTYVIANKLGVPDGNTVGGVYQP
jgi:hypothetical protein